jgi:hypothetical protein
MWTQSPGLDSGQIQGFFSSRLGLGLTHSPVQWVLGLFSEEVKATKREAGNLPPHNADVSNGGTVPLFPHTSPMMLWLIN